LAEPARVTDGKTHAAYFGVAITVQNGNCVDIHEGDRRQVVNAGGSLVSGHRDSFEVGCSHSWTSRVVWDPRTKHYVMVCATDNACRIAWPDPHLVSYGTGRMLLAWASGSSMAAQVYDAGSGKTVGGRFTVGVNDHNYQAFKAYPDGRVAYPAAGSGGTSIRIARVMPLNA
jgi:hypothetical protein